MSDRIVRDEVTKVRTVVTVGPVDGDALGTFGWFIGIRSHGKGSAYEVKDRGRYGACVICRRKFADLDQIHMVFNVVRNGKTVGNRLCCGACAEGHATFHRTQPGGAS